MDTDTVSEAKVGPHDAVLAVSALLPEREKALLYVGYWLGKADEQQMGGSRGGRFWMNCQFAIEEAKFADEAVTAAVRSVVAEMQP